MLPVKKFLMECRKEQIEIEILTQQQDYLRASLLPRSIAPRDMDVQTSTPGDHMAETFARVADYEAEIIRHRERLLKRQALARRVIDQLDQTLHRQVLTLYYLGAGKTATGLDGKNVINSDDQLVATSIVLQDGYNFCPAYNFTAESISYKRTFEAGWTTLMLPFEVTTIPEGLTAYEFVSEDGDEVTFKQLSKLSAFEACLLRVDAAKEYTFTATNQKVLSGYMDAATAKNFKFIGITSKPAYDKAYMLSADGSKFVLSDTPAYQSFRGCFVPTYGATYLPEVLTIKGTPTGIKTIQTSGAKTEDGYYNLAGQRVGDDYKGIVIHHGKKMLRK